MRKRPKQKRMTRLYPNSEEQDKKPDVELFRLLMIANRFGDGWHKSTVAHFVRHMIEALFGNNRF